MLGSPEQVTRQRVRAPMAVEEVVLAPFDQDQVCSLAYGCTSGQWTITLSERVRPYYRSPECVSRSSDPQRGTRQRGTRGNSGHSGIISEALAVLESWQREWERAIVSQVGRFFAAREDTGSDATLE